MKQRDWSRAEIEEIPIKEIAIGERRREKLGPITNLAASIERDGLIHPIVITEDNVLVVGRRRLAAALKLGWRKIPVRRFEKMTPEELRQIELDENTFRLDLSDFELSKTMVEEAKAEGSEVSSEPRTKPGPKGGRPKGGTREQARRSGVPKSTLHDAKKHVSAAERYPVMQGKEWKRGEALDAASTLDAMDEFVREAVSDMIHELTIPKETARKIIKGVASKPKKDQREIAKLYRSDKPHDVSLAKTRAAEVLPSPWPALTHIHAVVCDMEKSVDLIAEVSDLGGLRAEARSIHAQLEGLDKSIGYRWKAFRAGEVSRET